MIKVKITELPGKSVRIERIFDNGEPSIHGYPAEFKAGSNNIENIVTVSRTGSPFTAITVKPEEMEINGEVPATAEEAVTSLNAFIGNFKAGGASPSTTDTVALSVMKEGINGKIIPSVFSWMNDLTVREVRLMSNAAGISLQTGGETYSEETFIGVEIPAGQELSVTDIDIEAGQEQANVIIIFKQKIK
jgi:hypothetical protein